MTSVTDFERYVEEENITALCHALNDRNVLIRRRAAQALGDLRHAGSVAALAAALHRDKDQYVLRWSIGALQAIGDPSAVEALTTVAFGERRDTAVLASQSLATVHSPQAEAAFHIRKMLQRNNFEGFATLGEESKAALIAVMNSRQFKGWPSGKRRPVLTAAVRLGITPPMQYRHDLIDMGLFVSGLHTVGDLVAGLGHTSALVRAAAAKKMSETGLGWTKFLLAQRFEKETRRGGERQVAVAAASALAKLGDSRGLRHYQRKLAGNDMYQSADAVRAVGEIGTPEAIRVLFEACLQPPAPAGFHNTAQILTEMENIGPPVVDALRAFAESEDPAARRLMAQVAARSRHDDTLLILKRLCVDTDSGVQQAALDTLVKLNTPAAAQTVFDLKGEIPPDMLIETLSQFTIAEAMTYVQELAPTMTVVRGVVLDDNSSPLVRAYVQFVQEQFIEKDQSYGWEAISARAQTTESGEFWIAIHPHDGRTFTRLKVTTVPRGDGVPSETFMAEVDLRWGHTHIIKARIDRFVDRLTVDVRVKWLSE